MQSPQPEISPLQISFSNEKGFQPSTPSQTSPTIDSKFKDISIHIKNPFQLFSIDNSPRIRGRTITSQYQHRIKTNSLAAKAKQNCHRRATSCVRGIDKIDLKLVTVVPSKMNITDREFVVKQKAVQRMMLFNFQNECHFKDISRLDNLLNRVQTHITNYDRLYARKRY